MRCLTSFATPSSLMGGGWPLAGETDAESGAALAPALDTDAPEGGVAAAEAPLCEDDGVVVAVVGADAAGGEGTEVPEKEAGRGAGLASPPAPPRPSS